MIISKPEWALPLYMIVYVVQFWQCDFNFIIFCKPWSVASIIHEIHRGISEELIPDLILHTHAMLDSCRNRISSQELTLKRVCWLTFACYCTCLSIENFSIFSLSSQMQGLFHFQKITTCTLYFKQLRFTLHVPCKLVTSWSFCIMFTSLLPNK